MISAAFPYQKQRRRVPFQRQTVFVLAAALPLCTIASFFPPDEQLASGEEEGRRPTELLRSRRRRHKCVAGLRGFELPNDNLPDRHQMLETGPTTSHVPTRIRHIFQSSNQNDVWRFESSQPKPGLAGAPTRALQRN